MGETIMYEDATRKREDLCLVLKTAEGRREYQTVIITLKLRAVILALMTRLKAETLAA